MPVLPSSGAARQLDLCVCICTRRELAGNHSNNMDWPLHRIAFFSAEATVLKVLALKMVPLLRKFVFNECITTPVVNKQFQLKGCRVPSRLPKSRKEFHSVCKRPDPSLKILALPRHYLRAIDSSNYDQTTHQRTDVAVNPDNGKPLVGMPDSTTSMMDHSIKGVVLNDVGDEYEVNWSDGHCSRYSTQFVNRMCDVLRHSQHEERKLWSGFTEEFVRESNTLSINFADALTERGMGLSLQALFLYGILLVKVRLIDRSCLHGGCHCNYNSFFALTSTNLTRIPPPTTLELELQLSQHH